MRCRRARPGAPRRRRARPAPSRPARAGPVRGSLLLLLLLLHHELHRPVDGHVDGALLLVHPPPAGEPLHAFRLVDLQAPRHVEGDLIDDADLRLAEDDRDRIRTFRLQSFLAGEEIAVHDERPDGEDQEGGAGGGEYREPVDSLLRLLGRRRKVLSGVRGFVAHGCTYLSESSRNGSRTGSGRAARNRYKANATDAPPMPAKAVRCVQCKPRRVGSAAGITTQYRST